MKTKLSPGPLLTERDLEERRKREEEEWKREEGGEGEGGERQLSPPALTCLLAGEILSSSCDLRYRTGGCERRWRSASHKHKPRWLPTGHHRDKYKLSSSPTNNCMEYAALIVSI